MALDPEARAQLARLLRDERLKSAPVEEVRSAAEAGFQTLVDGIVAEAAASDDVIDRASAIEFVELRLAQLGPLLGDEKHARLLAAVQERLGAW